MKNYLLSFAAICVVLSAMFFFACENKPAPANPPAEMITLETAVWQLTNILVDPTPMQVPDTLPVPLTIKFSAGKVEGFGGCNGFGGEYNANGNQLKITGLIGTKMYCEGTSNWENIFLQNLEHSQSYTIRDETLEIDCGDMGGLVFRLNWKKR